MNYLNVLLAKNAALKIFIGAMSFLIFLAMLDCSELAPK